MSIFARDKIYIAADHSCYLQYDPGTQQFAVFINNAQVTTLTLSGLFAFTSGSAITAGTTRNRGGATVLTKEINRVDTSTAPSAGSLLGDGVALPASVAGVDICVINNTSNPIQVYGSGSDTINNIAATTGVAMAPNSIDFFVCAASGAYTYDAGVGYSGQLNTVLSLDAISAAGATQAAATALTADFNRVTTATANQGVSLPSSSGGLDVLVLNHSGASINVYGFGSTATAGGAISNGSPTITMAAGPPAGFQPGQQVYDVTAAKPLGTVSTWVGTTLTLTANASNNGSGSSDTLFIGDNIDDVAGYTGVSQMNTSVVLFTCYAPGKWYTNGLATGYAPNPQGTSVLETMQYADNLTATTGGQGSALQLTAAINTISTCPSGGGVNLPASAPGLQVTVVNNGANPLLVFPAQGATDTINGAAATVGVLIFTGVAAQFNCTAAGAWTVQPGTTKHASYSAASNTTGFTATAAQVTGGDALVVLNLTGSLGAGQNLQLPTVASVLGAMHSPAVGSSYVLRIINTAGTQTWTLTTNTGWGSLNGTATIATNTWRDFLLTITSVGSSTGTVQSIGVGTQS